MSARGHGQGDISPENINYVKLYLTVKDNGVTKLRKALFPSTEKHIKGKGTKGAKNFARYVCSIGI